MNNYVLHLLFACILFGFEVMPYTYSKLEVHSLYTTALNDTIPNQSHESPVPENFEFLDHINKTGQVENFKLMSDGILYTCDNGLPYEINFAGYDYTRKNLYTSEGFTYAQSKFIEIDDTTTTVLLYNLVDYDIGAWGFVQLHISRDSVEVMDSLVWNENFEYNISDVEMDTLGNLWCQTWRELLKVDATGNIRNLNISDELKMYQSGQGHLYFFHSNSRTPSDTLFYFDGETLTDTILNLPYIHDIILHNGHNYLVTNMEIIQYSHNFSEEIMRWSMPEVMYPNISITDHGIAFAINSTETRTIYLCGETGRCNEVFVYPRQEDNDERLNKVIANSDSTVVTGGFKSYGDIFIIQPLLRNVNIERGNEYDRRTVDVSYFEIRSTGKDTTYVQVSNGDTTIFYDYRYDVRAEIHNRSDQSISLCDAFSQPFSNFANKNKVHLIFDTIVPPNGYVSLQSEFSTNGPNGDQSSLLLGVPGADFRINEGRIRRVDFISSNNELLIKSPAQIYPNPTTVELTVQHTDIEAVTIYNLQGQLVYHRDYDSYTNPKLNVAFLEDGTYLILVRQKENRISSSKFVKVSK